MSGASIAGTPLLPEMQRPQQRIRRAFEGLVVVICTLAFIFTSLDMIEALLGRDATGTRDFVEYWASGQQLVHHLNPYDSEAILRIERSVGLPLNIPAVVMGNAPFALPLVYAFGFLSPRTAELLWIAVLAASLVFSIRMIRSLYGAPGNHLHYLGYAFGPALVSLAAGQASLLVLLGLVLFLRLQPTRPFLAGASLWFCALKPQLFVPFGLVLLVWILTTKSYKVIVGAVSALGITTAIAFALDPLVWRHYTQMMAVTRLDKLPIPCLSISFRSFINPHAMWLQYLPCTIASTWALIYFSKHRRDWKWTTNGSQLVLVSVLAAPYTWLVDQVILIPALLQAAYLTRSRALLWLLALASALIVILPRLGFSLLHSSAYLWTAPFWLVWYLLAARLRSCPVVDPPTTAALSFAHATEAPTVEAAGFSVLHEPEANEA